MQKDVSAIWRVIPDFNEYEASSSGEIRRCRLGAFKRGKVGRCLSQTLVRSYPSVTIWQDGKRSNQKVHRLVALAFCENASNDNCVRHLDGNPLNNAATNLAWGSHADNMQDMLRHGRTVQGERQKKSKLNGDKVRYIRCAYANGEYTMAALAKCLAVDIAVIHRVVHRKTWKHID